MARYDLPSRLAGHKHLFLVDHALSQVPYDPARGFVAPRFANLWPDEIDAQETEPGLEDEVVRAHVRGRALKDAGGRRGKSPWVDASASWLLALWHASALAERGYSDVHLSVISVNSAPPGAQRERKWYALDLLRTGKSPALSVDELSAEERWASVFQQVLVFGHIPPSAIVSRVPVERLIPALPANFFHPGESRTLDNLIWFNSPQKGVRIVAPVGISAGDPAHPGVHTEEEIGHAGARLAIATLHVPPCAILAYRLPIDALAKEIAQAFSSSAYPSPAWERIERAVQKEIDCRHREFVQGVKEFVTLELEYAQQSLDDITVLVKGTLEDNFMRPPRPHRPHYADFVNPGEASTSSSAQGSAGGPRSVHSADTAAQSNTLSRLAGIIEATREFENCIRAARRVLDWLVPLREEDELVKEVLLAAVGALAARGVEDAEA
ncbi:hypothetical protein DACRYDRAFT_20525 [Dacryopinax primogenitus]|uniref:DUF7587 domain-containing protein n=1 Tax=Dacryopinax primogenitus (strain DJM 731) TaxID=1858805 RepID=M5GDZ5_DACPD|nr:uncharacterized protein DACRYDRAFT_20525 [Dacryopinax primogenitus]EJU04952.1 hypothetical protein DACRYDRAFT_20525 [Dacryopinax primogenitus]